MATLSGERVAEALRTAMPEARIEVVEFSRQPIPSGELRFPLSGLPAEQATVSPLLWQGVVSVPGQDDFPVWAKVRIQVSGTRWIATETLVPGRPSSGPNFARNRMKDRPVRRMFPRSWAARPGGRFQRAPPSRASGWMRPRTCGGASA